MSDVKPRAGDPVITPALIGEHGLTKQEYERLVAMLGRAPTFTELGIVSALWSEHCSYKHSRPILKTLPTTAPYVLQGPGENAGVISIGDGLAVAFKIESHNHPSAVEPYQGAATGVGGILRDVFTMGARPIAMLNSLRFGSLDDSRVRYLFSGVVKGIGDYGNCVGIPTVAGEIVFDPSYEKNPLVNAMCVGLLHEDDLIRAKAEGVGVWFDEGDAEMLPYQDASFDLVVSLIGAMFAPVPERVASEFMRVCRPGGRIVMANWTPDGHIGQMFKIIGKHVPPSPLMPSPLKWGDDATVRERLKQGIAKLDSTKRLYPMRYPFPPADVVEFFRVYYGPTNRAFSALDGPGRSALRQDLEALWSLNNLASDGTTHVEAQYLEVVAIRD